MLNKLLELTPEELSKELLLLNKKITDGEIDIVEAAKKVYTLKKFIENFWKSISDEVYDDIDSNYSKHELLEKGITIKFTSRFDNKSICDSEYNKLKAAADKRLTEIKDATKYYQKHGNRMFNEETGEEIPIGSYGRGSKSVSFKI